MKLCDECGINKGTKSRSLGIRICSECKKLEAYRLITKSTVKADYFLTDKDIQSCPYSSVDNPYHKKKQMYLYRVSDILDIFCKKHDIGRTDTQAIGEQQESLLVDRNARKARRDEKAKQRTKKDKESKDE